MAIAEITSIPVMKRMAKIPKKMAIRFFDNSDMY